MKKAIIAIAALMCAACTTPAEKAVKNYLESNSNDGNIEIVEMTDVEDYTYTYDPALIVKSELDFALYEAESALSLYNDLGDTAELARSKAATAKAKELQAQLDTTKAEHYPMKRTHVKYRGKNALGATVLEEATLYLSNDMSKVSAKPNEVI
ncbi:MAG: hypothetical protein IKJ81_09560 [Bacteroidales bacterium]|nr:hypothetical protein [Bacteroidales bacterium]